MWAPHSLVGEADGPLVTGRLGTSYAPSVGDLVGRAARAAEQVLAVPLPRRWSHVEAVAAKAAEISRVLGDADSEVLVASAWLHDLGYAPGIARTGLHALDGAR
jgi:hypothetical protein